MTPLESAVLYAILVGVIFLLLCHHKGPDDGAFS